MRLFTSISAVAAAFSPLTAATHLTLRFQPSNLLPNPASLPPTTHAVLTSSNETLKGLITKSNTIEFAHIPPGSYLCDIYTRDYNVVPLRVDVKLPESEVGREGHERGWEIGEIEVWQTFRGNEWDNKGEKYGGATGGCEVNVILTNEKKFYEERTGFSPLTLLQNPMILIGVVGMAIMVGMPKLMENMDPEMREEFEKQQKSNPLAQGLSGGSVTGGFDMASWMAGSNSNAQGKSSSGSKPKKR